MANKPLQSITFPDLSNTYTIPQLDTTLSVTGKAADAKAVGDEIDELKSALVDIEVSGTTLVITTGLTNANEVNY